MLCQFQWWIKCILRQSISCIVDSLSCWVHFARDLMLQYAYGTLRRFHGWGHFAWDMMSIVEEWLRRPFQATQSYLFLKHSTFGISIAADFRWITLWFIENDSMWNSLRARDLTSKYLLRIPKAECSGSRLQVKWSRPLLSGLLAATVFSLYLYFFLWLGLVGSLKNTDCFIYHSLVFIGPDHLATAWLAVIKPIVFIAR